MNYRKYKKLVPNKLKPVFTLLLLIWLAFVKLPIRGFFMYLSAKRLLRGKSVVLDSSMLGEKSDLLIEYSKDLVIALRKNFTDLEIFEQIFLMEDCKFPKEINPEVILDAGSHIGCSALYFNLMYPKARIICLEASRSNFEQLEKNTSHIRLIEAVNAALWHEITELVISNPTDEGWSFRVSDCILEPSSTKVPAVTVSSLLTKFKLDKVSLFKLDIEGAEKNLFASPQSQEWISLTDRIIIELHDNIVPGCTDTFKAALDNFRFVELSNNSFNTVVEKSSD